MLGKMILTLLIAWIAIMLWTAFKWLPRTGVVHGPRNRIFMIACSYCGCLEETNDQFGVTSDDPDNWDKFACTKCKREGKDGEDAGNKIDRESRYNGS